MGSSKVATDSSVPVTNGVKATTVDARAKAFRSATGSALSASGSTPNSSQVVSLAPGIAPAFAPAPLVTRVEDQVNWGQGLAAVLGLFGAEPSPAPKLPAPFLGIEQPSVRWTG